jgi:hypothetical protein
MKKLATAALVAFLGLAVHAQSSAAQSVYLGGGGSFPISDFGDYTDTGFLLVGGGAYPIGEGALAVNLEGFFGQNGHSGNGDKTNPYGVMGGLIYGFGDPEVGPAPYLFGEAGIMWHKYSSGTAPDSTDSGFGYGAGAGVSIPVSSIDTWVEGRIMNGRIDGSNTMFVGAVAGVSFSLGG